MQNNQTSTSSHVHAQQNALHAAAAVGLFAAITGSGRG